MKFGLDEIMYYGVLVICIGFLSAVQNASHITGCGIVEEEVEEEEVKAKDEDGDSDSDSEDEVQKKKKKKVKKEFADDKKKPKSAKEAFSVKGGKKAASSKKSSSFPAQYYNDRKDEWAGGDLSFLQGPPA
jgi:hypothetical protein